MNIDGKSSNDKESIINIGLHVEAIDEDGNWSEAEIINIIDNNLILKFLDRIETYNRIIDISSNKWHHIENSKTNNYTFRGNDFEKGDFVLAKWHDDNYYLSQILDITTKTKFGTKIKEYHILYLYDNVHEIVPKSRLKSPNSSKDNYCDINSSNVCNIDPSHMNKPLKKHYKRRSEVLDCHENDNVFYDEKTKKFTENCKLRRLKLSNKNGDSSDCQDKNLLHVSQTDTTQPICELTLDQKNMQSPIINHVQISKSNCDSIPAQRYSQRKRRSSYKKADYFYPDSIDNMLKEKNRSSNNNSQVSTPIPFESNDEILTSSPKIAVQYSFQNSNEFKDYVSSFNQSPISVSLTSTEYSPNSKHKTESVLQILDEKDDNDIQVLYKINDDGKYQCLICTNKTFRKKQLVFDHLKHYHPTTNEQSTEPLTPKVTKTVYSPNKRYYSSYLKTNRTSIERKKKFNKSKIKSLINRNSWNIYSNRNHKNDYRLPSRVDRHIPMPDYCKGGLRSMSSSTCASQIQQQRHNSSSGGGVSSITYCHRCKKSSEGGHMIQCDVCLCWSHAACYGLSDSKDNDSFWECDNCANISVLDGTKSSDWYRDRCRFHSIPKNELPWMTKNAAIATPCSIKNICEIQSLLSLCARVLEAITLHMDKLTFKNGSDSNSQDDLDILKNFCDNIDVMTMPRIENLDSLALNVDSEEIFRVSSTIASTADNAHSVSESLSSSKLSQSLHTPDIIQLADSKNSTNFHFNEVAFINSTPNKRNNNTQKSINTSFDGILDCEIQRLEIIPKADFDALVKDLNLSDDICKHSNHSKSSILDLIDDSCKVTQDNLVSFGPVPSLDFAQSSCLYRNSEIDGSDPMIELSNDDIASLLLDKLPHKTSSNNENVFIQDHQQLSCLEPTYSSDFNTDSIAKHRSHESPVNNTAHQSDCFIRELSPKLVNSEQAIKLDLKLTDWPSDVPHVHSHVLGPSSSSAHADTDPRLSSSDSKSLQWLLSKYQCIEQVVESIEETIVSSRVTEDVLDSNEEQLSQMSKYLHSLLYILR